MNNIKVKSSYKVPLKELEIGELGLYVDPWSPTVTIVLIRTPEAKYIPEPGGITRTVWGTNLHTGNFVTDGNLLVEKVKSISIGE